MACKLDNDYDFYIISNSAGWEEKVIQDLQRENPDVKCLSRKDRTLGKYEIDNLIEPVKKCKKVLVGFTSEPVTDKLKYVSATAIQRMLDDNTLDQGKLILVKVTEDAVIPPSLETLSVFNGWEEGLCHKLVGNLLDQDILKISAKGLLHHSQAKIEKYLIKRQEKLCENACRFTPATMNTGCKVDIAELFTELELVKENDKKERRHLTTLENVSDIIKSKPGCKILIDGEGGIGKSTILRLLAYNWATDKSNNAFEGKIVFPLNIRDLEEDDGVLDHIGKQLDMEDFNLDTDLPKDPKLIKRFIKVNDKKIVWLLDGLDELKFNNKKIIGLFKRNAFENSTVILTSRSENIDEFKKECNLHVRVNGFSEENIGKYIDKHFAYVKSPSLGSSLKVELEIDQYAWKRNHQEAYSMSKNPMLLLSICNMWEERQTLPHDKADLFKEIFRSILNQFNKQQETYRKISDFEDTPLEYVNAMVLLGKCMYNSLKVNQLSINKRDLKGNPSMVEMALKLGFVYKDTPISKSNFEEMFMPPHKLIVESLVGFYLYKLCDSEATEGECSEDTKLLLAPLDENEWEVIRESEHLEIAREFTIGFLGTGAVKFLKHWITNNLSSYRSLMYCLNYVKKQHEVIVKNTIIDYMVGKNLEIKKYMVDISSSIRMFLRHITPDEHLDENEHFIHLSRKLHCLKYTVYDLYTFCDVMTANNNGKVIAHILGISTKLSIILNLSSIVMNEMIRECSNVGGIMGLRVINISNNNLSHIDGTLLGALLIMSPSLSELDLHNCRLTGDVINHMIIEVCNKGNKLTLGMLNISDNNFSNIDGTLLGSLLIISPKLWHFFIRNCNLSGDAMNHMVRECSDRGVKLALEMLFVNDNHFRNLDGNLLRSLLIISPRLWKLDIQHCNLTSVVMNDMMRFCSTPNRPVVLVLTALDISGNNLGNIDGTLLSSLLSISSKQLDELCMSNCNLLGFVLNDMIRNLAIRKVLLVLNRVDISGNNLRNIDGTLLGSFLIMSPKLWRLDMHNCNLSGDVMNQMIRECSNRRVELALEMLFINDNNFSDINGTLLRSLFTISPKLWKLDMQHCNLSADARNYMNMEGTRRELELVVHNRKKCCDVL
ncbi:uncharacterized protein [Antedon mediterranea]|uniref:uncharacterized protein n=1 Tax=Antedon mediterranea TaxID=105859 RepID=UPI003AF5E5FA